MFVLLCLPSAQEYLVKQHDRVEFLAMLGAFGALLSFAQMLAVEQPALAAFLFPSSASASSSSASSASASTSSPLLNAVYLAAFAVCMLVVYSAVPLVLRHSSATAMNLSFLTSDFFSLGAAIALFGARLIALYFVAFVAIVGGVALYNMAEGGAELRDWWRRVRACAGMPPPDEDEREGLATAAAGAAALDANHVEAATSGGDSVSQPDAARTDAAEQHRRHRHGAELSSSSSSNATPSNSSSDSSSSSSAAFEYIPLDIPSAPSAAIALSNREVLEL